MIQQHQRVLNSLAVHPPPTEIYWSLEALRVVSGTVSYDRAVNRDTGRIMAPEKIRN